MNISTMETPFTLFEFNNLRGKTQIKQLHSLRCSFQSDNQGGESLHPAFRFHVSGQKDEDIELGIKGC